MSYLGEIAINSIYIIESIPEGDFKSGHHVYEDIIHLQFKNEYLSIHYKTVDDFSELEKVLAKIHNNTKDGECPLIHFEPHHANQKHFVTKDGNYNEWGDFLKLIQPINIELNLRLLVSIGACYSAYLLSHMYRLIKEPAPCLASIGSAEKVSGGALSTQYTHFYKSLINKGSLSEAHKELKNRYPNSNERLLFIHAPKMFKDGFKQAYINRYSGDNWNKNIERLKSKIKKGDALVDDQFRNKTDQELGELLLIGSVIQKDLSPKLYANKFFMCDLYPENYQRFDVEQVVKEMKQIYE